MARLPMGFTKKSDGRLQYAFTMSGKRYYVAGKTVAECREKAEIKRREIEAGIEKRDNPTVAQYFDRWLENREIHVSEATQRKQTVSVKTLKKIQLDSKKFGDMRLKDVRSEDLRSVQRTLSKDRTTGTTNDYMALVKHIFADAKADKVISDNPASNIKMLKRTEEQIRNTKHRALTNEEQEAFFECEKTKQSAYYNVFRIAVLTGMRGGEIGALKYSDIQGKFIHVQRTITKSSVGGYMIGESAKTEAGKRKIPLKDKIKEVIRDQKRINHMLYGNVISVDDTIFKSPQGNLLKVDHADREIKRICKEIGIEPITMHGFRATYATRCIEAGMNPRTLQELLGHTNFNLTMSLYGHVVEDTLESETEKVRIVC